MVKIIFLADTHLGFDYPLRPKKNIRRRGIDFFNNFDKVLDYAKTSGANLVIHGGDLFFRTRVPPPIIDMVYERIFNFAHSGIPIVIVPGNHESSRLPVSLFMQHPNIYYFTKPQVFNFSLNGRTFDIAGFPCVRNGVKTDFPGIVKEIKNNLRKESIKLLCMHQSVEGAKVGPADFTFRFGDDVIPIKDIPNDYDLILSGHIHRAQILWADKTPVIYPGSIERTAFAEKDEEKGFYEIEFDDELSCKFNFMKLNTRPMIDVILQKEIYTTKEIKEELKKRIKSLSKDSILRLKFTHEKNLSLLKVNLLDEIIPVTMNYQISGYSSRNES